MSGLVSIHSDRPVAVIGDVHGRADLLAELLVRVGDRLVISVGDVVDRGPDVKGCITLLLAPGAGGVLGDHEEWVQRWVTGGGFDTFALHPAMGGDATLRSYGVVGCTPTVVGEQRFRVPADHVGWCEGLADSIDLPVLGQCVGR